MFVIYILIACVIAYIVCREKFDICLWTCCLFLLLSGLGFNTIDEYRMGNIMMPDIGLLFFAIALFFKGHLVSARMKYKKVIMLFIFVVYLILGIVMQHSIDNIFRDIKNYFYFILPTFYFSDIKDSSYKLSCIFKTLIISTIYTLVLCLYEFFFVSGISAGDDTILKFYGIGIGADFLFYMAIILFIKRDYFLEKMSLIGWTFAEILLIFGAFSSFVRSSWLVMFLVVVCGIIVGLPKFVKTEHKIVLKDFLRVVVILAIILSLGLGFLKKVDVDIVGITTERVASIKILNMDKNDTLFDRVEDVMANKESLTSPIMIMGHGMGAEMTDDTGKFTDAKAENSFMYYAIKFGYPLFIYLCLVVCSYLYKIFRREDMMNKMTAIFLAVALIVQSMSGNLNNYYISPFFMMLLILNMNKVVDAFENKGEKLWVQS